MSLTNGAGGQITTEGKESYGIFGQSIGGGGGNGSSIVNITATGGKGSTLAGLNIGGTGGDGNASGDVSVVNGGLVQTTGEGAHGIFAQSIAGGGGNGGLALAISAVLAEDGNAPLLAIGGTGGDGADAGDVTVTNSGQITTSGQEAHGIVAQSIGGGGGNANVGFAIGGNNPKTTVVANALSAAIGAFGGGDGGLGGKVTVNHSGNISVSGEGAQAIKAESINGGGGDYVLDFNGITSLPGGQGLPGGLSGVTTDPVLVLRAGGEQTLNSTAGAVTLNVTGTFTAVGDNGAASSVQAIGGGGGNAKVLLAPGAPTKAASGVLAVRSSLGGKNGTNNKGGRIASALDGAVTTAGNNAPASLLQSIGGGGGRSTIVVDDTDAPTGALTLSLGAKGGSGETGAAVSHDQDGAISTTGDLSVGMLAQSIGGGGGLASYALNSEAPPPPLRQHQPRPRSGWPPRESNLGPTVGLAMGGNGVAGADGAAIRVTQAGDTTTSGDHAAGLVEQSIGGGGGFVLADTDGPVLARIGGDNGASGDGATVALANDGAVSTTGIGAHGILLQSIGGGGGAVFTGAAASSVTVRARSGRAPATAAGSGSTSPATSTWRARAPSASSPRASAAAAASSTGCSGARPAATGRAARFPSGASATSSPTRPAAWRCSPSPRARPGSAARWPSGSTASSRADRGRAAPSPSTAAPTTASASAASRSSSR